MAGQHEADLEIVRAESLAGKQAGEADDSPAGRSVRIAIPVRLSPKVKYFRITSSALSSDIGP